MDCNLSKLRIWYVLFCILFTTITFSKGLIRNNENLDNLRHVFSFANKNLSCIKDFGRNISEYLKNISSENVTDFCFKLKGSLSTKPGINILDLSILPQMKYLQDLWILPDQLPSSAKDTRSDINYDGWPVEPSGIKLRELHIKVQLYDVSRSKFLICLLQNTTQLEVLHLEDTHYLEDLGSIQMLLADVPVSNLKALSLSAITIGQLCYSALNLTDIFQSIKTENLKYLDLSKNNIYVVYGSITATWPKLRIIDLSQNMLFSISDGWNFIDIFVLHPSLEVINVEIQNKGDVTGFNNLYVAPLHKNHTSLNKLIQCVERYNITINQLVGNHSYIKKSVFCDIIYCYGRGSLDLSNILYVPCSSMPITKFIEYALLFISSYGKHKFVIPIAPNLKEVIGNDINVYHHNFFHNATVHLTLNSSKLVNISLSSCVNLFKTIKFDSMVSKYYTISGIGKLRKIDISNNRLHMYLCDPLLASAQNIITLNIERNYMKFRSNDTIYNYFPRLENLNIAYNNLTSNEIPISLFENADKLKTIDMAGNQISIFNLYLNGMEDLVFFNISNNKISKFELETIAYLKHSKRNLTLNIDLQNNVINCGCSVQEISTIELIKHARLYHINFINSNLYTCYYKTSYKLLVDLDISKHKQNCRFPYLELVLGIIFSNLVLVLSLLSVIIAYKYRYRLVTKYLRLKNRISRKQNSKANFQYDAFVSYCANDRFWVHDSLVKMLEETYGFNLCIHYRDFMLGRDIVDEIVLNMLESKIMIIVLSEDSLKSPWCDFELKMAHTQSIELNKELLIIKLGNIDAQNIDPEQAFIRGLLQSRVYISWPEEWKEGDNLYEERNKNQREIADKKLLFWMQLSNILYGRNVSCCWCCKRIGHKELQSVSNVHNADNDNGLLVNGRNNDIDEQDDELLKA